MGVTDRRPLDTAAHRMDRRRYVTARVAETPTTDRAPLIGIYAALHTITPFQGWYGTLGAVSHMTMHCRKYKGGMGFAYPNCLFESPIRIG